MAEAAAPPQAAAPGAPPKKRLVTQLWFWVLIGIALGILVGLVAPGFARQLASARLATAKYATDLDQAKADGYQIITRNIPNMGWHFMNPKVQDFDVRRPPILVYEKTGPTT